MNKILIRKNILKTIRNFFEEEGFSEVETPLLVPTPDPSPYNEVFETAILKNQRAFLAPSPEFFMKKLLSEGSGNIFQICKAFRNPQELDPLHNPEFTILEWYRTGANYTDLMKDCENLIASIYSYFKDKVSNEKKTLTYQNQQIDITPPWPRISICEAFKKFAEIDLDEFLDFKKAKEISIDKGYRVEKNTSWEQLFHQIFLNEIEPKLPKDKPLILYDYPAPLAALAKLKAVNPRYAERFEFYIGGLELGNGYSELTDFREQEQRLKNDVEQRKKIMMKVFDYDRDFIKALKTMPVTAGMAVGVDRLMLLFANTKTIQEVIPFPANEIFRQV